MGNDYTLEGEGWMITFDYARGGLRDDVDYDPCESRGNMQNLIKNDSVACDLFKKSRLRRAKGISYNKNNTGDHNNSKIIILDKMYCLISGKSYFSQCHHNLVVFRSKHS